MGKMNKSYLAALLNLLIMIKGIQICGFLSFLLFMVHSNIGLAQNYQSGFGLEFEDTADENIAAILDFIAEDQQLIYDVVNELNENLALPVPVPIKFGDCGQSNAFYMPDQQAIVMCYEMIAQSFAIYQELGYEGEDLSLAVGNNTISILLHEIGHALVDILKLPITGREEDAVDQFSAISLLFFEELGNEAIVDFASFWGGMSQYSESSLEDIAFFGEHSLDSQRFYDILCLAYGSNQKELGYLVDEQVLPQERAERCTEEFQRIVTAWDALLSPYYRE